MNYDVNKIKEIDFIDFKGIHLKNSASQDCYGVDVFNI